MTMTFESVDAYLAERDPNYEYRAVRYRATADMLQSAGLDNDSTLYDLGAGWTEFDFCVRAEYGWRGRYIPVDAGMSHVDLDRWKPERPVEYTVALEIIEHLHDPEGLVRRMQAVTTRMMVVSVPNPRTVDVLGIDETHVTIVTREMLESWGFTVAEKTFYGGVYSDGEPDALFAVWTA